MGWKDWDRTNKVIVSLCAVVALAVIATFAILALRPKDATPPELPPETPGASQSSETPTPTPSPTYACTTASGPDCTKDLAEKEAARDKAYADAETTFRKFNDLLLDEMRNGGADDVPDSMKELASDEVVAATKQTLNNVKKQDVTYAGFVTIEYVRPADKSPEWPSTDLVIDSCSDGSKLTALKGKDKTFAGRGSIIKGQTTMKLVDDRWIIADNAESGAESC